MNNVLNRLLGRHRTSAHQAKERLQLVLIHDRTNLNSTTLSALKDDLIDTISQHVEIDPTNVKIEMNQDGRQQRLIADIPIRGPRRPRF